MREEKDVIVERIDQQSYWSRRASQNICGKSVEDGKCERKKQQQHWERESKSLISVMQAHRIHNNKEERYYRVASSSTSVFFFYVYFVLVFYDRIRTVERPKRVLWAFFRAILIKYFHAVTLAIRNLQMFEMIIASTLSEVLMLRRYWRPRKLPAVWQVSYHGLRDAAGRLWRLFLSTYGPL